MQSIDCVEKNEPLLRVENVFKIFSVGKQLLTAVSDVSFTLNRGELLGIVGESGCGKSTLARIISGSLTATSGSLTMNGVDYLKLKGARRRDFRRNIQMVFQEPLSSFSPRMRIGTYLMEPRRNFDRISKTQALEEAGVLMEQVGLSPELMNYYPHELSGGQLQRVAIARAIVIQPSLLLCDEATSSLDVSIQSQIVELLVRILEEKNIGCIFISHDLALVSNIAQRIAVMYLGRIVEMLPSQVLKEEGCHPYTRALLDSVFDVYCDPGEEIRLLQGEPPSPLQIHEGCAFAPRCSHRMEQCRRETPKLRELCDGHLVACFR